MMDSDYGFLEALQLPHLEHTQRIGERKAKTAFRNQASYNEHNDSVLSKRLTACAILPL